jgi:hypothetical protein
MPRQQIAVGLIVLMVWSGIASTGCGRSSSPPVSAQPASAQPASAPAAAPQTQQTAEREQLVRDVEQQFRAIETFAASVPIDTFDPGAVLAKTGREPAAIFHWVRDETLWVPYRGVLRGPLGVLMDRKGNDLDRALLLAQLLNLAGKQVRLARSGLSDSQATAIVQASRPRRTVASPHAGEMASDVKVLLSEYVKDVPSEAANVRKLADDLLASETRLARETRARSASQARDVATAVALPASSERRASEAAALLDRVRDHWWVQVLEGAVWIDLDPTMPNSEPGRGLAGAQSTTAPEALERTLYHEVEIHVIAERWQQGHLEETPVLTHVMRPSDMVGVDLSLSHLAIAWPQMFDNVPTSSVPERLRAVGLNQHEWLPVLRVGPKMVYQFSFTDAGLKQTSRPGSVAALGTNTARGVDSLSALFGSPSQPTSVLTAESVEYEIRSPGEPVRKIRRQLFDRIGPAQRAANVIPEPKITDALRRDLALTLMGKTDILVLNCDLSRDFVAHRFVQSMLANRQSLFELMSSVPQTAETAQAVLGRLKPIPGPLYSLALVRSRWSAYRDQMFIDRPVILSAHARSRDSQDGKPIGSTYSFDIVANDVAVNVDSNVDPAVVRLAQGVLDTNAEAVLSSELDVETQAGETTNVSEIYARSRGQGVEWVVLRSTAEAEKLQLPPDLRARIGDDLSHGYAVVTPSRVVMIDGRPTFGWWRVDSSNGTTLGIGEQGWGASMAEYALLLIDTSLCMHEFWPKGGEQSDIVNAGGMLVCAMLGGSAAIAWAAKGAKAVKGAKALGLNLALAEAVWTAGKHFFFSG